MSPEHKEGVCKLLTCILDCEKDASVPETGLNNETIFYIVHWQGPLTRSRKIGCRLARVDTPEKLSLVRGYTFVFTRFTEETFINFSF